MINSSARGIFNRRPNINYVSPKSSFTIPEPVNPTTLPTPKEERVNQLLQALDNVAALADVVEDLLAKKAKNEVLKLDLSNPEDAVTAQAAARLYPEKAIDKGGFVYVPEITFDMYFSCIQAFKAAGIAAGDKQNIEQKEPIKANKTDFGGMGKDQRPDVNRSTIPFAPIDIPSFIAAGIPLLFGMLFPLINVAIKKDIVGHTHPTGVPPTTTPSGPGIPLAL